MTAELACWLLWLTDSVDGGGTDMFRTIAAEVVDHAPDSSSEEALLEKTLRGTASGKSSAPVLKRKIRPSAVRGGGGDESAFAGEADEEEFEDEQHQNFRRSSPPAAKRSKKKQPGDSLHRKGGPSAAQTELSLRIGDAISQKSDKELLGGGYVEWTFHQEAKVIVQTTSGKTSTTARKT